MAKDIFTPTPSIVIAQNICPDFKVTNSGSFIKNDWTEFADKKLLTQPEMESGITMANYPYWLDWTYEMLSESDHHDPLTDYAKDMTALADNNFKIPWLMSFKEKGFNVQGQVKTKEKLVFKRLESKTCNIERELINNRFGEPVILERHYKKSDGGLYDTVKVYKARDGQTYLRLDDPNGWSYQQDWFRTYNIQGLLGHPTPKVVPWQQLIYPLSIFFTREYIVSHNVIDITRNSLIYLICKWLILHRSINPK